MKGLKQGKYMKENKLAASKGAASLEAAPWGADLLFFFKKM